MNAVTSTENQAAAEAAPKAIFYPNPDKNHQVVEMKFGFRTIKDEKTGVETKRQAVEIKQPVLNYEGVVAILSRYAEAANAAANDPTNELLGAEHVAAKKEYDLLMSAVQGTYESAIKSYLGDNADVTSENFPYDKFTWTAIANEPESERRGRGIAKEVWEDFVKSYKEVMPGLTGKKQENIDKQAAIIAQKFNPLKNHEDKEKILPNFEQALTVYLNGAAEAEQFAPCIAFLLEKIKKMLTAENDANLAANLGFE